MLASNGSTSDGLSLPLYYMENVLSGWSVTKNVSYLLGFIGAGLI